MPSFSEWSQDVWITSVQEMVLLSKSQVGVLLPDEEAETWRGWGWGGWSTIFSQFKAKKQTPSVPLPKKTHQAGGQLGQPWGEEKSELGPLS